MNKLFIIGNGFDLAHSLPTSFDPDFKEIATQHEAHHLFWKLYQSEAPNIWSDFENLLAKPDFNILEKIFDNIYPDYSSDHESDRDSIIVIAQSSGNLKPALKEFARQAELKINQAKAQPRFIDMFGCDALFITFNYTHTLQRLYGINSNQVLHIHGEVGMDNLILGYPDGNFECELYSEDVTKKGRYYRDIEVPKFIESIEDFYIRTAYQSLYDRVKSFSKSSNIDLVRKFINNTEIEEIIVIGHSYKVDFPYFEWLYNSFPNVRWIMFYYDSDDKEMVLELIKRLKLTNYKLMCI